MNRNVTILIVILTLVVLAGYLIWLRGRLAQELSATPTPIATTAPSLAPISSPSATPVVSASPSATPKSSPKTSPKVATASARPTN